MPKKSTKQPAKPSAIAQYESALGAAERQFEKALSAEVAAIGKQLDRAGAMIAKEQAKRNDAKAAYQDAKVCYREKKTATNKARVERLAETVTMITASIKTAKAEQGALKMGLAEKATLVKKQQAKQKAIMAFEKAWAKSQKPKKKKAKKKVAK